MTGERREGFSTVKRVIRICLTDTQLGAHFVMALYLGPSANGHCNGGPRKESEVRVLTRHAFSPRSSAELSR
jgi:hypothetical protein